jgi:hypothetical protein
MLDRLMFFVPLVVACVGSTSHPVADAKAPFPAPLYAGMFVEGAKLRYELVTQSSQVDDQDTKADTTTSTMTCTIEKVEKIPDALVAHVACDAEVGVPIRDASPAGIYVATAEGLWRVDSMSAVETAARARATVMIPSSPRERHSDSETQSESLYRGSGDEWCWSKSSSSGDDADTTMCFSHGLLVTGSATWAGGSSREASYVLR